MAGRVWLRLCYVSWVGFMDQWWSETPQIVTIECNIWCPSCHQMSLLPAIYSTVLRYIPHRFWHLKWFTTLLVHRTCRWTDLHRRQQIRLLHVANFARDNSIKAIGTHRNIVQELPLTQTVQLRNKPINIIRRRGMVARLHSSHFQVLRSFISTLHSTRQILCNQPPVQAKDIRVVGHSGKAMTSTKDDMVGLKCSPLR